jgi:hypothetical protein
VTETARSLRGLSHTYDPSPGVHWRPGVVWAIAGASATVRVFLHTGDKQHEYTVATSSLPHTAIGGPIVARFTSQAYASIVELQGGLWPPGGGPGGGTAEADAVARGQFYVGVIPRSITKEPEWWD